MENIIGIAADWFEKYLADGNTIDDWCRDSENVENGRKRFFREMDFKPLQYYVDNYPLQIVDKIDEVMDNFDTITDCKRIKEYFGFRATFCIVDDIIRPQKDDAKWRTQLSLEFTL